ncbi:MAG: CDP-glucose 4,6-dehydratase [Flavobacterium sp.]|nr:MAG: CDP-glucose 4,6-dehydratase [Flavobacterium sp.]
MLEKLRSTYKGKKVFVTGHTGFKGAWMLAVLQELGAEVKGYALEPETEPNLYSLIGGNALCQSVMGDIRDKEKLAQEISIFQPDYIYHLAAQSLVRKSYDNPLETYEINVMGTSYLLDAVRRLENPCKVVVITTDKVYENREIDYPYKEEDPLGGFDPYSSSKACAEIATASYRRSFFHPDKYNDHKKAIATARAGNVIGGGDWAKDRIIPDMVRAWSNRKPLWVRNPDAVRPWEHVLEPVVGYLVLGMKLESDPQGFAQAYNFGPHIEDNLTVGELVKKSAAIWEDVQYQFIPEEGAPHEAKLLRLDISKTIKQLGWQPKWNSEQALTKTLEWYKNYKDVGALKVTLRQIEEYLSVSSDQ